MKKVNKAVDFILNAFGLADKITEEVREIATKYGPWVALSFIIAIPFTIKGIGWIVKQIKYFRP